MHACMHACIHVRICACTHAQQMHAYIYIFKATKDIAAGQEIFYRYGGLHWFEGKNIPYIDVDYASTRWRPDLQPLPCRKNVTQTIGADGRRSYAVREAVPSGAILEISLCLEVTLIAVDQFPFLWDFVLTRETETVPCWLTATASRAHAACVFADQDEGKIPENAEWVLYSISPVNLFECSNP